MRCFRLLGLCIVVALVASGCAGASERPTVSASAPAGHRFSAEQEQIAAAIADYKAATRRGDTRRLCERILFLDQPHGMSRARRVRRCATSGDLAQEIKDNQGKDRYGPVEGVRISGLLAVATVSVPGGAHGRTEPFYLNRRFGGWRIAARGLTPAHTDFRVFPRLDCRRVVGVADDQLAVRAVSAVAFMDAYLDRQSPRRRLPIALALVGVDFRNAARTFDYRTPAGKVLARYVVHGTDPYSVTAHSFCATSTAPFP